ncbi:MAG: hypothetical protein V1902_03660 [Candidatus Falkowbacteria bacterium]
MLTSENKKQAWQIAFWIVLAAFLLFAILIVNLKYFAPQILLKGQTISTSGGATEQVELNFVELKDKIANEKRFSELKLQAEFPLNIDKTKINKKDNPFKAQ